MKNINDRIINSVHSKVSGFSLLELMMGLSISLIAATVGFQLLPISARMSKEVATKQAEDNFFRSAQQVVTDRDLCTKQLKGKPLNIGNAVAATGIKYFDDVVKLGDEFSRHITVETVNIENVSAVPIVDDIRSAQLKVTIKRKGLMSTSTDMTRIFPFFLRVNAMSEIEDCGNIYMAESLCKSLRGTWDPDPASPGNYKCNFDKVQSCIASGSNPDWTAAKGCSRCYNIGGDYNPTTKECKVKPPPDSLPSDMYDGKAGGPVNQFVLSNDPPIEISDVKCRTSYTALYSEVSADGKRNGYFTGGSSGGYVSPLVNCTSIVGNYCGPAGTKLQCMVSVTSQGNINDLSELPRCMVSEVVCQLAPTPPPGP
jgi:prepilin-type N-terminal cleavage/methylation domain-containing protein